MELELVIKWNQATGAINVSGPIDNKLLAYGLLAVAKDTIAAHHEAKARQGGLVAVRAPLEATGVS